MGAGERASHRYRPSCVTYVCVHSYAGMAPRYLPPLELLQSVAAKVVEHAAAGRAPPSALVCFLFSYTQMDSLPCDSARTVIALLERRVIHFCQLSVKILLSTDFLHDESHNCISQTWRGHLILLVLLDQITTHE